jgi:threonylcarbamoyladenosine tRNA methylthiotransferase MtaB
VENGKKTVGILTLGCKVNQYESEAIAEECTRLGMRVLSSDDVCDVYIVNTCTVTAEADRKSCQMIRQLRSRNPGAAVIVTGCTSQRDPVRIAGIPGVYAVVGNAKKLDSAALAASFDGVFPEKPVVSVSSPDSSGFEEMRLSSFPRTRAYIKIEDGCNNRCSYCAISGARGRVRSKDPDAVMAEVLSFCEKGCREIVLTGIETASYGKDSGGVRLGELLRRIDCAAKGYPLRIRLGSLDPTLFLGDFCEKTAGLSTLANHFHLSVQSGSSAVLASMRRPYNRKMLDEAIDRIQLAYPVVLLSADVIAGFPGETEEDLDRSVELIKSRPFIHVHVFPFSVRKGTAAAALPGQLPMEEKRRRASVLTAAAEEKAREILDGYTGRKLRVLFETFADGTASGHSDEFIEVRAPLAGFERGVFRTVKVLSNDGRICTGAADDEGESQ